MGICGSWISAVLIHIPPRRTPTPPSLGPPTWTLLPIHSSHLYQQLWPDWWAMVGHGGTWRDLNWAEAELVFWTCFSRRWMLPPGRLSALANLWHPDFLIPFNSAVSSANSIGVIRYSTACLLGEKTDSAEVPFCS